jgi:hypothetical protein
VIFVEKENIFAPVVEEPEENEEYVPLNSGEKHVEIENMPKVVF